MWMWNQDVDVEENVDGDVGEGVDVEEDVDMKEGVDAADDVDVRVRCEREGLR